MTAYEQPTFSVPTGSRSPEVCQDQHWWDVRGKCVLCGTPKPQETVR